jgi:hypothetical protein
MGWIRKCPFASHEEAVTHMLDLLGKEAERTGTPLTDAERGILELESGRPFRQSYAQRQ